MTIASTTKGRNIKSSFVLFTLRGKHFAIDNSLIFQIIQNPFINPVANTIPYFLGSTAFQGKVLAAIDLGTYFYGIEKDQKHSDTKNRNFLVVDYEEQTIFLKVESIIGIIGKPDETLTRDLFTGGEVIANSFFNSAFMWEANIVVQLKIDMIFNQILLDSNISFQKSISSLQVSSSLNDSTDSLEGYNIDLQHQIQRTAPISGWRADRLIRPPKEVKYTGTVISVQDLSILIPNENLSRIFSISQLTEIPNTSDIIVGAINYQGEIINAINLEKLLLGNSDSNINEKDFEQTRALIVEYGNEKLALMMDEIPRIIEIQKTDIRQTITLNNEENANYIFKGVLLEQSGNIILILNIHYIFTQYFASGSLEKFNSPIISFQNPDKTVSEKVKSSSQEGLLIQNEENLYFIDSEYVSQIVKQEVFFKSDYGHDAILGVTSHQVLSPLVDFNFLVQGQKLNHNSSEKLAGVILHDQKSGLEATFIVQNILGRTSIEQLDVFQPETSFYTKMLSQMISGFFSFNRKLGIIVKPKRLIEETYSIIRTELSMQNVEDMVSKLLPEDKHSLTRLQDQNKERELYLTTHLEKDRLNYLVFQWGEVKLAIDVAFVQGVFSTSVEITKSATDTHPILGKGFLNDNEYPILDLAALILVTSDQINFDNEIDFFSIVIEEKIYLVPVDKLEAVVTTFKDDLIPSVRNNLFLEGNKCCQNQFIDDDSSSSVIIVENEFLTKTITKKGINPLITSNKQEKNEEEE
jgi:chemotaxis signal transduction protein